MEPLARLLALLLAASAPRAWIASRYADTPADEGGTPACHRRCLREEAGRCVDRFPEEVFHASSPLRCAHRRLPCGTTVLLVGPAGSAACVVLDRGPHGRRPDGTRRGDLDTSPAVAARLGLCLGRRCPGRVPVIAVAVRPHR